MYWIFFKIVLQCNCDIMSTLREDFYMKTKKEQKFDLLESLRKAAESGLIIVQGAIFQAPGENVHISGTIVKQEELTTLEIILGLVQKAETIEDVQMLLDEDSLPVELVIMDQFWGDFQELIYKLPKKENQR